MIERKGNMFTSLNKADALIIPTNTTLRKNGNGIAGAGVAKLAQNLWPEFEIKLGEHIREHDWLAGTLFLHGKTRIVALPTKRNWRENSDLKLIEYHLIAMKVWCDSENLKEISLPRLGCGLGGLNWNQVVKPLCEKILDDRFVVYYI